MVNEEQQESISKDQLALASRIGVDTGEENSIDDIVRAIEETLGQNTLLEQARYFVLSVLNHANRLQWRSLSDTSLSNDRQLELARLFIASDDLKQSLRTVLKDNRFKFTLLKFAKTRNVEKRVLSTTTKAFKEARKLLVERALIDPPKKKVAVQAKTKKKESDSLVDRRAARRGYFNDEFLEFLSPQDAPIGNHPDDALTDEEFDELDAKLSGVDSLTANAWTYHNSEDRLSLLVGLAAGSVVFATIIWMFV